MRSLRAWLSGLSLLFALVPEVWAGALLSPAVRWQSFSFRPLAEEPTPNYYGYGLGLTGGYSFGQVVDFTIYAAYTPARLETPSFAQGDASLLGYGGELAFRIAQAVYFGVRGGSYTYDMQTITDEAKEIPGTWTGVGGGLSLGAIHAFSRVHFFQASIDLTYAVLKRQDADAEEKRKLDAFSLSLAYVFNANDSLFKSDGGFIKSFVDSIFF